MEKQTEVKVKKGRKGEIWFVVATCFFFVFTLIFYGPLGLYLSNSQELSVDLQDVLKIVSLTSVIGLALSIPFLILTKRFGQFLTKLLLGVSIALYVQGTYINIKYGTGVADGSKIAWENYNTYGIIDTIAWVVMLAIPFIIGKIFKEKEKLILTFVALALTAMQLPALAVQLVGFTPNAQGKVIVSTEGVNEFAKENIIVFALDTVDEEYWQAFLEKNPDYVENLEGFVHYDNTFAAGGKTMIAVPAMLTGQPFTYEDTYTSYLQEIWNDDTLLAKMHDKGYDVRCFLGKTFFSKYCINFIDNFKAEEGEVDSYKLMRKLYKLDLFTYLPHYLKERFELKLGEFSNVKVVSKEYKNGDAKIYRKYIKPGAKLSTSYKKAFRFYLLVGAHAPYELTREATAAEGETSLEEQMDGAMLITQTFLQNLRDIGVYDSSTIIIMADHGEKFVAHHPFFMIKRANDKEPYRESHVPVSQFDLAVYINKLSGAGWEGNIYGMDIDELTEDMERERHYFLSPIGSSRVAIEEYVTKGNAADDDAIIKAEVYESKQNSEDPYKLGTKLFFTMDGTANKYVVNGFLNTTGFSSWLYGSHAELRVPMAEIPEEGTLRAVFRIVENLKNPSNLVIKCNGVETFRDYVDDEHYAKQDLGFDIPIKEVFTDQKTNILTIEFEFLDMPDVDDSVLDNPDMEANEYEDIATFGIRSMKISKKKG